MTDICEAWPNLRI